jgi:hypothetical protein
MSTYHVLKTRNAPPSLFAAGKGVGRRFPLVLSAGEYQQHKVELRGLKAQGYITITRCIEVTLETSDGRTVEDLLVEPEPSRVAKAIAEETELAELLDKVEYVDEARAEPEPEPATEDLAKTIDEARAEPEMYDLSLLDQSITGLTGDLAEIDDVLWLDALREAEEAGKTRKGALAAIKERREALEG